KRVQKLKAAGFLRERPRRVNEPSILSITLQSFRLLRDKENLTDGPRLTMAHFLQRAHVSDLTIRHELEVMDVKVALTMPLCGSQTLKLTEFSTWPRLYEFQAQRPDGKFVHVQPDGFIRIQEREVDGSTSEHAFFLEVDRSTE